MAAQLQAGAQSFVAPFWQDLADAEPNIDTDNPLDIAVPQKLTSGKQLVRKSYPNQSWSSMNLAAELAGENPLDALQNRVTVWWDRQIQNCRASDCRKPCSG